MSDFKPFPMIRRSVDKQGKTVVLWVPGLFIVDSGNVGWPFRKQTASITHHLIQHVMDLPAKEL